MYLDQGELQQLIWFGMLSGCSLLPTEQFEANGSQRGGIGGCMAGVEIQIFGSIESPQPARPGQGCPSGCAVANSHRLWGRIAHVGYRHSTTVSLGPSKPSSCLSANLYVRHRSSTKSKRSWSWGWMARSQYTYVQQHSITSSTYQAKPDRLP
jgi:hypothetical protein